MSTRSRARTREMAKGLGWKLEEVEFKTGPVTADVYTRGRNIVRVWYDAADRSTMADRINDGGSWQIDGHRGEDVEFYLELYGNR